MPRCDLNLRIIAKHGPLGLEQTEQEHKDGAGARGGGVASAVLEGSEHKVGRAKSRGTDKDNNHNHNGADNVDKDRDQGGDLEGTATSSVDDTSKNHQGSHDVEVLLAVELIVLVPDIDHRVHEGTSSKNRSRASCN